MKNTPKNGGCRFHSWTVDKIELGGGEIWERMK